MINAKINTKSFIKDMQNILNYSNGFLEGAQKGKEEMLLKMGLEIKQIVLEYVDTMARVDPSKLQHVYEWAQAGNGSARLFDDTVKVYSKRC